MWTGGSPWRMLHLALGVVLLFPPGQGKAEPDRALQDLQNRVEALELHYQKITGHPPPHDDSGPDDPVDRLRLRIEALERLVGESPSQMPAAVSVPPDGG